MRISAMVSHDLKNAIAGLSMLVSNMEKQFHREEFRADAIESLREATEKLKRTDRKSTRLNSSHANISYAVFCLKKKNKGATRHAHRARHTVRLRLCTHR